MRKNSTEKLPVKKFQVKVTCGKPLILFVIRTENETGLLQ